MNWLPKLALSRVLLSCLIVKTQIAGGAEIPPLQPLLNSAVEATLRRFAADGLKPDELGVSVRRLDGAASGSGSGNAADYRGDVRFYPASVVKLFYLAAAEHWLEQGKLTPSAELDRALHDMIVVSYNEATHYVVDVLTGTTSGPELSAEELEIWYEKRNAVNRYFSGLGYRNINVNRKPWCEGPYGREIQSMRVHQPNHRNFLTTEATARLMSEIATGQAVSSARSAAMRELLRRDPFHPTSDPDDQATGFMGKALRPGDQLWSKAGWTSEVRHDAAYVELAEGPKLVLVIFTVKNAMNREIIPALAGTILDGIRKSPSR